MTASERRDPAIAMTMGSAVEATEPKTMRRSTARRGSAMAVKVLRVPMESELSSSPIFLCVTGVVLQQPNPYPCSMPHAGRTHRDSHVPSLLS